MRVYVAKVLANANATSTRNFLERFCAQNIATKDVEDIANNVVNKMKSENEKKRSKKKIQNTIMRSKLHDANKHLRKTRFEMIESRKNLDEIVRKGTLVRELLNEVVSRETTIFWESEKKKYMRREEKAKQSKNSHLNLSDKVLGVIVKDSALQEIDSDDTEVIAMNVINTTQQENGSSSTYKSDTHEVLTLDVVNVTKQDIFSDVTCKSETEENLVINVKNASPIKTSPMSHVKGTHMMKLK